MSESVVPSSLPLEAKTESIPPVVVANPVAAPVSAADEPAAKKAKVETTPVKDKTPKKRALSQAERTQKEAEALIGDLNKEVSGDGPRRTRSQTRGTPAPSIVEKISPKPRAPRRTDTPAVKKTPASGSESAKKGRGRGRKGKPGRKPGVKATEPEPEEEAGGEQEAGDIEEGTDATDGQEPEPAVVNENGQSESTEAAPVVVAAVPVPESKPTSIPEKTVEPTPPPPPPVVSASPVKEIPSVTPQPQEPQAPPQPEANTVVVAEDDGWN